MAPPENIRGNSHHLSEYRLSQLEQNFTRFQVDLETIKEAVQRLENKFTIIEQLQKDVEEQKKEIQGISKDRFKALGGLAVIIVILNLFGPAIGHAIFGTTPDKPAAQLNVR